ncbi:hypothetical protein BVI434_2000004 [Burkholderia vietnamiensis]|nr:hypothetical protein BVI434_2000004 [Burkholderia vietnamiensis]
MTNRRQTRFGVKFAWNYRKSGNANLICARISPRLTHVYQ